MATAGDDAGAIDRPAMMAGLRLRLREIFAAGNGVEAADGAPWMACWDEGVTPWDLGEATPAVAELVWSGTLPSHGARVLVPGCGGGHDVVALSGHGRFVVGLDLSDTAIRKAKQRYETVSNPNLGFFEFVAADFFTWLPADAEPFDLIFDYTFFCAFDPSLRSAWASKMDHLLKPDGELITLMFLLEGAEVGPPFNTAVHDYEEVLKPLGFVITSIEDNQFAVETRKGKEKLARWKKMAN